MCGCRVAGVAVHVGWYTLVSEARCGGLDVLFMCCRRSGWARVLFRRARSAGGSDCERRFHTFMAAHPPACIALPCPVLPSTALPSTACPAAASPSGFRALRLHGA